ncbi:hypothetical protein [Pantoea sp. JK]|uniref:hypothetical protein n=1 Tax=Pantoea sp. JK TaxID=2871703 RepID=UPI0022374621|nr:hypothetical protein [Pantoea sp. JK]MCW6034398.1 hypothetical protein [Pantoea sp. JK]
MDNISNATLLTLTVTIFIAAVNFFFGIHGRLKKFSNERISVYKEISSLEDSNGQLSDAKEVAKQKLKSQVLFELTKLRDTKLASLMLHILKKNSGIDIKKETSVRTVIDCLDQEVTVINSSFTNTTLSLSRPRFRKKRNKGALLVFLYITLSIIFSQAAFSFSESREQLPMALATGLISLFMIFLYALCLIKYPILGSFNHYNNIISNLEN